MSSVEILAHMSTFYLDAYETTARMLSLVVYCLAMHPDVQQRLREEINSVKEEITIDVLNKLPYMEMVLAGKPLKFKQNYFFSTVM